MHSSAPQYKRTGTIILLLFIIVLAGCQQQTESVTEKPVPNVSDTDNSAIIACTPDTKICPDGREVRRNPNLDCAFEACEQGDAEEMVLCTMDVKECPGGIYVGRDPKNQCRFPDCPEIPDS